MMNGLIFRNPIVMEALGLFPIIAGGTSLKNGVVLSAVMGFVMIPICLCTSAFGAKIAPWVRAALYVLFTALLLVPATFIANFFMPNTVITVSTLFIPLIAVNALITVRAERYSIKHGLFPTFIDTLANVLGFALVICSVSAIREILGSATLWGNALPWENKAYGLVMPFGGFIILGFMSAFIKFIKQRVNYQTSKNSLDYKLDKTFEEEFEE